MKIVLSQRVDIITSYAERRDALDQNWIELALRLGTMPIVVPNSSDFIKQFLQQETFDAIVLTGGNSLVKYGGDAPERDLIELVLLEHAIKHGIPLIGICRGMQVIQDYFGVELRPIDGHVATRHPLIVNKKSRYHHNLTNLESVNSYHNWGSFDSNDELIVGAHSVDKVVMQIEHNSLPIYGQMWHSEREHPFIPNEIELLKLALKQK